MPLLEKKIEADVGKWVKKHGGLYIKLAPVSSSGLPDRMVLLKYRVIEFIEFKRPGEKPTSIQRYFHGVFNRLGFKVHVVDNYEAAIKILDASRLSNSGHADDAQSGGGWPVS